MKAHYALLAVLLVAACSKGKKAEWDGKVASCNMPTLQSCREYRDANLAMGTESLAKLCGIAGASAKFTETPCPTADVIGVCAMNEGVDFMYTGYPIPIADAEKSCKERGHKFRAK